MTVFDAIKRYHDLHHIFRHSIFRVLYFAFDIFALTTG